MYLFLVILSDHLKQAFRSKKAIVFLALYLAVFFFIAHNILELQRTVSEGLDEQGSGVKLIVMGLLRANTDPTLVKFLDTVPFMNVALFFVSIFGTPILLLIQNYDKISQDVYDGTIRYVAFRSKRWQIYTAKFASSVLECALVTLLAIVPAVIWAKLKIPRFDFNESIMFGLRYWAIALVFLSVICAFSLMWSSILRKPFSVLIASFVGLFALMLIPVWVPYASPFDGYYTRGLMQNMGFEFFASIGAYLGFCLLFFGVGFVVFQKKDI